MNAATPQFYPIKHNPRLVAILPIDGLRRHIRALQALGYVEVDPRYLGLHSQLERGNTTICIGRPRGWYQLPQDGLTVCAIMATAPERREIARALRGVA